MARLPISAVQPTGREERIELNFRELYDNIRTKLTADRTYYVRQDGSNSNTGLANTAAGAFLTIQYAFNYVLNNLDLQNHDVTIQVADGTGYAGVRVDAPQVGEGFIYLTGNMTTPANVTINTWSAAPGSGGSILNFEKGIRVIVRGFDLSAASGELIYISGGSYCIWANMRFGACGGSGFSQIDCDTFSYAKCSGNYEIYGGGGMHLTSNYCGVIQITGGVCTVTGTPAFEMFAFCSDGLIEHGTGATFSGTATGYKFWLTKNGCIDTQGGGINKLPGDAAGILLPGGQYDDLLGGVSDSLSGASANFTATCAAAVLASPSHTGASANFTATCAAATIVLATAGFINWSGDLFLQRLTADTLYIGGTNEALVQNTNSGGLVGFKSSNETSDAGVSDAISGFTFSNGNFTNGAWRVVTGWKTVDGVGTSLLTRNNNTGTVLMFSAAGGLGVNTTTDPGAGGILAASANFTATCSAAVISGPSHVGASANFTATCAAATLAATTAITSLGKIGYAAGAGGSVTQITNKSTGVTINKVSGQIIMDSAALNAGTSVTFVVTNSQMGSDDTVILAIKNEATPGSYLTQVCAFGAGTFSIHIRNITAGNLSEAVNINFAIIKTAIT